MTANPAFTPEFLLQVSQGRIPGWSAVVLQGHNADQGSAAEEDVWDEGGTLSYLTTAETMDIASADAADTAAGTGVNSVKIEGLDGDFEAISEVVLLNGTSDVETTLEYVRVNKLTCLSAGSGETNAGTITATASTAGSVQEHIEAGDAVSHSSHYTVPAGCQVNILRVEMNVAKLSGGQTPLVEFFGKARLLGLSSSAPWVVAFNREIDTAVQDSSLVVQPVSPALPGKTDIRMSATTDQNSTITRTRMFLVQSPEPS